MCKIYLWDRYPCTNDLAKLYIVFRFGEERGESQNVVYKNCLRWPKMKMFCSKIEAPWILYKKIALHLFRNYSCFKIEVPYPLFSAFLY